jgi:hypothetical protein
MQSRFATWWTVIRHLVGDGEQRLRHFEAERFGGLEIDHQFVFDADISTRGEAPF